jgi:hypothetical protein
MLKCITDATPCEIKGLQGPPFGKGSVHRTNVCAGGLETPTQQPGFMLTREISII